MKTPTVLSGPVLNMLRRIVAGEMLTAVRTFPRPFHFKIGAKASSSNATDVPASNVSALIEGGYLRPRRCSPLDDFIAYAATDKGIALATDGPPPPDDSQLDWTAA